MFLVSLFSWWYGTGWLRFNMRLIQKIGGVLDFFSIGLLLRSLFAPFKQISVGQVQGSIEIEMRAWFDLQLSRVIGAVVRLMVVFFGLITTVLVTLASCLLIILWPLIPVIPIIMILIAIGTNGGY
jgi:hypothetical protein